MVLKNMFNSGKFRAEGEHLRRRGNEEGDVDTKKLEEKLDKAFGDLFKNFDSGEVS